MRVLQFLFGICQLEVMKKSLLGPPLVANVCNDEVLQCLPKLWRVSWYFQLILWKEKFNNFICKVISRVIESS